MLEKQSEADWEWYGKNDPYFGVISSDRFSKDNLTEDNRAAFFAHGEDYVETMLQDISRQVCPKFHPARVLDFGCGVGRVAIPLAKRFADVVGVDISPSMLRHAKDNCASMGVENARFMDTSTLDTSPEQFDLVHSFIVFQHIPVADGEVITRKLLELIAPDGVGVLHYTYHNRANLKLRSRLLMAAYRHVPLAYKVRCLVKKSPVMQMNEYNLNHLLSMIQRSGCGQAHLRFTDHGTQGVVIMFRKQPANA